MTVAVTLETFLAETRLRRDLEDNPADSRVLRDLIGLCLLKGQAEEALRLADRLVRACPDDGEAQRLRGEALARLGQGDAAFEALKGAVALDPDGVEARLDLGRQAEERQDWAAALEAYYPCAERDLSNQRAMMGVVNALSGLRRYGDAARALAGLCVHQWPDLGERLALLADLLRLDQRPDESLAVSQTTRMLFPENGMAAMMLGRSLVNVGRPVEGLRELDRASGLGVAGPAVHLARSAAFHLMGCLDDAAAEAGRTQELDPANSDAVSNRALVLMAQGRWDEGLSGYEKRLKTYSIDHGRLWNGEAMEGCLLVLGEQGLGDQVQCLRYLPLIRSRVKGRLVVQLADPLLRLARDSIAGVDEWRSLGETSGDYDRVIPMMSLIKVLDGGAPGSVPVPVPFLRPPAQCLLPLPCGEGLKVGLCWAGGPGYLLDSIRSMPAAEMARLVRRFPQIRFHRLQRGPVGHHVGEVRPDLPLVDAVGGCADYADTAAVIDRLDLVISVDTSLAHVAAALGKETWILIPHVACFRWGQEGEESRLYPSARLIRQQRFGEGWGEVMDQVARRLEERLASI